MKNLFQFCGILLVASQLATAQNFSYQPSSDSGFYRFDAQPTWLHGFHRSASPFSGQASYRPTNYRQAIARAAYTEMYPNRFLSAYTWRPTPAESYRLHRAVNSNSSTVLPQRSSGPSSVPNEVASPILSLRVAHPVSMPDRASVGSNEPRVIRAIQREETGPLFPLPPIP